MPCVAGAVALLVTVILGAMANAKTALPVPEELVAPRLTEKFPNAVGLPLIRPVVALTVKPGGSPLAVYLVGLWLAVIW